MVRRHRERAAERAYDFARGPVTTPSAGLVRVAGSRGRVKECLELAKGDCRLDEYEMRGWTGWHRHVALSLFALAVVVAIRVAAGPAGRPKQGAGLARVSVPEVRTLLHRLVWAAVLDAGEVLACSVWRRARQHRTRRYHYREPTHSIE